jgi:low temperature requirement protein LtrA
VVVLVSQAAHHLAGKLTWRGLGEFCAVFALVWIAWLNGSLHHELHGREDARGRSTFLLQIAAVCLGVAAVRPAPLLLCLALIVLLAIPWALAVRYRVANAAEPAS